MDNGMVHELLKELRDEQKEQGKCLSRMEVDVNRNTEDMILHMEQTKTVKDLHAQNEKRIEYNEKFLYGSKDNTSDGLVTRVETLEVPAKAKEYLRKKYMKVAAVVAITLGIIISTAKILGKI